MNKIITQSIKVVLTASALAAALTGCCLFGSGEDCHKDSVRVGAHAHAGGHGVRSGVGGGVH